ncbi:MAG: hypothetical protein N3B18_01995 [Desulfobacterota bacterium]|nr:hypothetical protein [Thermodesulfobacteriota bacterium]
MFHLCRTLFLCCLVGLSGSGVAASSSKNPIIRITACGYGGGGRFTAVAIDPNAPNIVLVGSDVAGVFKSTDAGERFHLAINGLESFSVASLLFDPTRIGRVFLLAWDGLYMSTDRGDHWIKISTDIGYRKRFSGSSLFAVSDRHLYTASDTKVVRINLDNDPIIPRPLPELPCSVFSLVAAGGRVYAATACGVFQYGHAGWFPQSDGFPDNHKTVCDIASLPDGTLIALEETTGVYLFDPTVNAWKAQGKPDTVHSWSPRQPSRYKALSVNPGPPECLHLATHPETWPHMLFRSTDRGNTWTVVSRFVPSRKAARNWQPATSMTAVENIQSSRITNHLYLADWWNVWKSTDAGLSWFQLHQGLQNTVVNDIKTDIRRPDSIFMAVSDNGLMVSHDNGTTWERKMNGVVDGHAQEVEISRANPLTMYLLINPWEKKHRVFVYRSHDGAEHWSDIGFALPDTSLPNLGYVDGTATNLEIDPTNDSIIYVATNGYGIFKTTNAGKTWMTINTGLDTPYIRGPGALRVHPTTPSVLFASTQAGGLYISTDAGATWRHNTPGHNYTFGIAIDPTKPSHIFVCCPEKKIIRSTDGGTTWMETLLPGLRPPHIAAYSVAIHPRIPQVIFVGTRSYTYSAAEGLFMSTDGGETFLRCSGDIPPISINVIQCTDKSGIEALLGFNGIGIFRATANLQGTP